MPGVHVLIDDGAVVVEGRWDRVHGVTTRDSVSGSMRSPVPVVTVLATSCISLTLASRERGRNGHKRHAVGVVAPATATSAASKGSGNVLPRRDARRKIPSHAFGLKKYLDRPGDVGGSSTSTSDDETVGFPAESIPVVGPVQVAKKVIACLSRIARKHLQHG